MPLNPDLPTGPFSYETTAVDPSNPGKGHVYIVDSNGKRLASLWGAPAVKMAMAALILEARDKVT